MTRGGRIWLALIGMITLVAAAAPASSHEEHRRQAAQAAAAQAARAQAAQAQATASGAASPAQTMPQQHIGGLPMGPASHQHMGGGAMADMAMDPDLNLTPAERRARMNFVERLSDWLGRWHTLIVHFPIALLSVALLLEVWSMIKRKPVVASATRVLIAFGALGAVAAAGLGWLAMGFDMTQDDWIHRSHRTMGTLIPVLALATWWARERFAAGDGWRGRAGYRALLLLTGTAVAVNGFLGGSMGPEGIAHLAW